jgi:hypothetical protein
MNESILFIVGIIVFAITVYGSVMAGGMALARVVLQQEPQRQPIEDGQVASSGISPDRP